MLSVFGRQAKVAVVGGGAAGLCAAIEAAKLGASVVIFDKVNKLGGNSAKASSGINGCETIVQRERHVEDSQELFRGDTIRVGGGKNHDLDLVSKLAENSSDAIDFLKDEIGLPLTDLLQLGGHSAARTHRLSTHAPIGFTMMQALATRVSALPNIEVRTSSNVLELSFRDEEAGRVICGLTYEESGTGAGTGADTAASVSTPAELEADAVIITAGGSAFDQSADGLMAEFAPQLLGMATSSGPQATGQGIQMARRVGASLTNPDLVQLHPSGFVDPAAPASLSKILAPEALRGSGGILVNDKGERFCNELGRRGYVTEQIIAHCAPHPTLLSSGRGQHTALMVLNAAAVEAFGVSPMAFYKKKGLVRCYSNAAALCAAECVNLEGFKRSLSAYSAVVAGTAEDAFGKKSGSGLPAPGLDEELFVASITPVIHYTLGGISVNTDASVRRTAGVSGGPLLGLYAAGEATGGVHGGDRLAGNSLLECVVFGRIAGAAAVSDAVARAAAK